MTWCRCASCCSRWSARSACSCISSRCSSRCAAFNVPFPEAQACGALLAMTSNFILNNFLTYRDQRLKGFAILRGLAPVLSRLQRRPVRQCRRGVLGLRPGADLVAGGRGRRADGRGLELRDVRTVRLAQAMNAADEPARCAARPQHRSDDPGAGGAAAGRRRLHAADLRRSLLLDVVEASGRRLLRSSADGRVRDPPRHHDRGRHRTRGAAGLDPAGAADELGGVPHRRDPVRRPCAWRRPRRSCSTSR